MNVCPDQNIPYIDHSSSIQQNHNKESKVPLNRCWIVVFANTTSNFLSEYYWWDHDNSSENHLVQHNYNKELKS